MEIRTDCEPETDIDVDVNVGNGGKEENLNGMNKVTVNAAI